MARTKDIEAIVEVDEEIQGRKRVNSEEDARPAKRAKGEGNKAAELPIHAGRNLGSKAEGEAAVLCDGGKTKEEEEEAVSDEVKRLRGLLANDPKKLSEKDVGDVIRCLEVDEIVSLALKSGQGGRSDGEVDEIVRLALKSGQGEGSDGEVDEIVSLALKSGQGEGSDGDVDVFDDWGVDDGDPYAPSSVKVIDTLREMLLHMEKVTEADLRVMYKNFSQLEFSLLLFTGLDSYSKLCCGGKPLLKAEEHDMIPVLCGVLPWKLFSHVLSLKTGLPLLRPTIKEERKKKAEEEEWNCTPAQKEGAEGCDICLGKGKHGGTHGLVCSFVDHVPMGATVGHGYWVSCINCDYAIKSPYDKCFKCGSEKGGSARWAYQDCSFVFTMLP